eukprot:599098-Rhodomonas_salina.1
MKLAGALTALHAYVVRRRLLQAQRDEAAMYSHSAGAAASHPVAAARNHSAGTPHLPGMPSAEPNRSMRLLHDDIRAGGFVTGVC